MWFHDIRHATATLLLQAGDPIQHVQRILCHANARTTVDTTGTSANEDLRAPLDQPKVKPIAHDDPSCLRAHKGAAERVECESH